MKRLRLLSLLFLSSMLSFGQVSKIAPDLLSLLKGLTKPVNVVIQYNSAPGLLNLTQLLTLGGTINAQYSLIPAIAVKLPAAVVPVLSLLPEIAYISPDRALESTVDPDINTASADADLAFQSGYTGAGVGIAIIDSGIYAHLRPGRDELLYHQSFVPMDNADDYGHGTHVAGIAAGSGASSTGAQYTQSFRGVAPGAHLVDLRVLDANGMSSDSVFVISRRSTGRFSCASRVQHSRDQFVAGAADLRIVFARSDLPGGCGGVEEGDRGGGGGRQPRPGWLFDHHLSRQQPVCDHGGRDEIGRYAFPQRRI